MANPYKYDGIIRAQVAANNDPSKLGRVKLYIPNIYDESLSTTDIPWATPAMSLFAGAGEDYGSFTVPRVESYVFVFFEQGNIYQPVYFAEAQSGKHVIDMSADTNYPNTKVWKTPAGMTLTISDSVDITESSIEVMSPTGYYLKMDAAGNVEIKGKTINLIP